ncbi:NADH-quinone oxidoreductase subunit J [Embleya sp. AB8]|uniref:NADH-quinone oxidoreductase subunit J family protein n=1 Tax=Embleya sp. AB8 TaxID=3156304 RepID=UPI003C76BACA
MNLAVHPATNLAATESGFLSPTGAELAFVLVGLVVLGSALLVVTTRQVVHAALWLVVTLGGLAAEYLLLTAEFIAWVQVLIYVGAVVVLLLFGLMLTKAPIGYSEPADRAARIPAAVVALGATATLLTVIVDAFRTAYLHLGEDTVGSTRVTGESLFKVWVLPFEVLSVLLLAALIGAIVLSRSRSGARSGSDVRPGRKD